MGRGGDRSARTDRTGSRRRVAVPFLFLFLCPGIPFGRPAPLAAQIPSPAADAPDTVSLERRAWIASEIHASIRAYFGHWEGVPDLDLEDAYRAYLGRALATNRRFEFDLATMRFMAKLENGHTGFVDGWLSRVGGGPVGFTARRVDGGWAVHTSRVPGLEPGRRIAALDGRSPAEFVGERLPYISASSEAERVRKLWSRPYLFPAVFPVELADGRTVRIDREHQELRPAPGRAYEERVEEDGTAYVHIPSFGNPEMEERAVAFLRDHATAPAMIVDVRANGGGTTPTRLIESLMDRPYRGFTEATTVTFALFEAYAKIVRDAPAGAFDDYIRGYLDAVEELGRAQLRMPAAVVRPRDPVYTGPLFVLIDGACASACEDFVMPLRTSGRATVIGESTSGSTGQPYIHDFGNGMRVRVSTKRVYFPDGSEFEGVGIEPHVQVVPSPEDLRAGRDPVLEEARDLAATATGTRP